MRRHYDGIWRLNNSFYRFPEFALLEYNIDNDYAAITFTPLLDKTFKVYINNTYFGSRCTLKAAMRLVYTALEIELEDEK